MISASQSAMDVRRKPRWHELFGVAYLLLVPAYSMGFLLAASGWTRVGVVGFNSGDKPGSNGLTLLAWLGVGVAFSSLISGRPTRRQWQLSGVIGVWIGAVAPVAVVKGQPWDSRYVTFGVIAAAVALAAATPRPEYVRRTLFGMGWVLGWGSVVLGITTVLTGWPGVAIKGDPRFAEWLQMLRLPVSEVYWLNGLSPGRLFLGMSTSLLLVYTVRTVLRRHCPWWCWALPLGLLFSLVWSFSRTGLLAAAVGLLATLLPYERLKGTAGAKAAFAFVGQVAILLVPLLIASTGMARLVSDGTTQSRFEIWRDYLTNGRFWLPLGLGPGEPVIFDADHAHNQLLQSQVLGGWVAVAALLAFLFVASLVAMCVAGRDGRATVGVLFSSAVIFGFDILSPAIRHWSLNTALVVLIAVVVSAAGLEDRSSDMNQTADVG